jgi:hypothetical protein
VIEQKWSDVNLGIGGRSACASKVCEEVINEIIISDADISYYKELEGDVFFFFTLCICYFIVKEICKIGK